jgi:hypothetical protein
MKRLDDGKVSFVEFMRSIRFKQRNQRKQASRSTECQTHFADFDQQARPARSYNAEDRTLVRSAN